MRLLALIFGCRHRRYSWPQRDAEQCLYVMCLDCSRRLEYNWETMKARASKNNGDRNRVVSPNDYYRQPMPLARSNQLPTTNGL